MIAIQRTNQGGSVATFIVVGVILVFGLIGTVYFLKQHGEQVRKEQAIAAYDKQQAEKKSAETKSEENSNTVSSNDSKTSNSSSDTTRTSQDLPTTGLELAVGELIGVFLLTMTIASYILSRRNLTHPL